MAKQIQLRRGTTTEHSTFTGAVGELTYDIEKKQLRVHDGSTVGGKVVDDTTRDVTSQVSNATETVEGKAKIATSAIAQAGVNDTDFLTAKKLRDALNANGSAPVYPCRAWVNFNGTGTVTIRASGNVSSITDNGVGNFTANFNTSLQDTNYIAVPAAAQGAGVRYSFTPSTNSISMTTINTFTNAAADPDIAGFAIFR